MRSVFRPKALLLSLAALLWFFPSAQALADREQGLVPMGNVIGIEMRLDGVMIVGLSDVETEKGLLRPAEKAGLAVGDVIISMGDHSVASAQDFLSAAAKMDGKAIALGVRRGEKEVHFTVVPEKNMAGEYQLGLWLRDGVSGIGTVTYYDPVSGSYGALGHGVNDADTGELVPVEKAFVTPAEVVDVVKGSAGKPGELCGKTGEERLGNVKCNSAAGIFGNYTGTVSGTCLPVARESEIVLGPAKIMSNVAGCEVAAYDVEICRVYRNSPDYRGLMLKVTDPRLLECTGGIVQGMSGSPIIQDGKLVGAVTHVLVNDPTRGYGIFIENMLDAAG